MHKKIFALTVVVLLLISAAPQQAAAAPQADLPDYAFIDAFIGHGQTYPLSCESRSAVDVAAYWGISIPEVTFFNNLPVSDNPEVGFVGSVFGTWGQIPPNAYGVHAQPVAKLLRQYGLDATAQMGMSLDELKTEIANGRPVVVWMIGRVWSGTPVEYTASDGTTLIVAKYEHTMVAYGYDQDNIYLVDAGSGDRQGYSTANFKNSWAVLGNMAVTAIGAEPSQPAETGSAGGTYVVQKGDYLTKLAGQWGISWQDLAALNGITYPYTIYPGQVLYTGQQAEEASPTEAPTATPAPTQKPTQQATTAPTEAPEATATPEPTATQAPTATPTQTPEEETFLYTVQRGEYLMQIAREYDLDWTEIAQLNGLTWPYTLQPGQQLKLPASAALTATPTATPEPTQAPTAEVTATPEPTAVVETYTVLSGEHLMQIARKLELSWTAIADLNGLSWPYTLYPGQVLDLPATDAGSPPPPLEEEGQTGASEKTYVVQSGEYLYTVAQKYGINWQVLAAHNNISYPYIVYPGQVLNIP